jgi:hemerythrin-like metal-binding protein
MNKNLSMFGVALLILTLIVAVILGFMAGPTSPLTWILVAILIAIPFLYRKLTAKDYLEWKDEYSVGIESIDQQHRRLVNLINQLHTAVSYSTGEEFEREALDELVDYTKSHFTYEEGLMEQNGYPDFDAHKAQHKQMIEKVGEVLAEYEKDQDTAMNNALDYLSDWLINHINGTDKQYSSFLIGKGVK